MFEKLNSLFSLFLSVSLKMEGLVGNVNQTPSCQCHPQQTIMISVVDILTFVIGQPVIAGLLWISFMSNKSPDVLNINLGVFYSFQYVMSLVHSVFTSTFPQQQSRFLRFLFVFAQIGGPTGLSSICIQRYVAVLHPASYPLLRKYKYCEVCAAVVWILSVPTAVGGVFIKLPSPEGERLNDVPMVLMAVMIVLMWRSSVRIVAMLRRRGPGKDKVHPAKKRAFRTIAATTTVTIMFYIPATVLQRLGSDDPCHFDCVVTPSCVFLLSAASVVHPLFYLYTQRKQLTCLRLHKDTS